MKGKFTSILEKESAKEMVSFLQSLTDDEKRQLAPFIKITYNDYMKSRAVTKGNTTTFEQKATDKQKDILLISSFATLTRSDFEKLDFPAWVLEEKVLRQVIPWYCPPWFSDFVNKQASLEHMSYYINYGWIMELTQMGLLQPSRELIVRILPRVIFEHENYMNVYKPEKLLQYGTTLSEQIWYLFELDSNIHYVDRYLSFGDGTTKENVGWKSALLQYSANGKIDRSRLLKESLLASNRNFNKVLSGWFVELFAELQPTNAELLVLQKELFSVLNSPHSKVVNTSLQMIKKLLDEKAWNVDEFLDAVPILLASDTKATVASTLMILEKITKKHKNYRSKICTLACQAFVHLGEELQTKAAKLILANRGSLHESFHKELAPFYSSMLAATKKMLGNIATPLAEDHKENRSFSETPVAQNSELSVIPPVGNVDDLVFLASQAFDNNATWHLEQLIAALVRFRPHLKPEDIPRFEPAFQRALGLTKNGLRSHMGYLEHLLAMFFIDFGNFLIRNFPSGAESIEQLFKKYDHEAEGKMRSWTVWPENFYYTKSWRRDPDVAAYLPYQKLLLTALEKMQKADDMPVLSTPTHAPGWIIPEILIDRLSIYQQNNREPDALDFELSISRCYLENTGNAYKYAGEKLSAEFCNIMQFLLDKNAEPKGPFLHKGAWMVASLTKKDKKPWSAFESFSYYKRPFETYTGQLKWESVDEEYTYSRYNYEAKGDEQMKGRHKVLRIFNAHDAKKETGLKKIFSGLLSAVKDDPPFLYDFLGIKARYLSCEHNDIKRLLLLSPNNPEPMLADIINLCLNDPRFVSEPDKKLVTGTLQVLHEIWDDYGEMAHVFVGTCMLSSDKTAANIAGEIWINGVTNNKINNEKIGEVIGLHERIEFAPLKRFTDLVMQQLFRISEKHNQALLVVVENILQKLPAEPITNLKKLLEIYKELLAVNNAHRANEQVTNSLEKWKKNSGLTKIIDSLQQTI